MPEIQTLFVGLIVLIAAVYLVRRVMVGKKCDGCGKTCASDPSQPDASFVSLEEVAVERTVSQPITTRPTLD